MHGIINTHWTAGGTAVTNFSQVDVYFYEEAIRRYGDIYLVIHSEAMDDAGSTLMPTLPYTGHYANAPYTKPSDCYSLHDLKKLHGFGREQGLSAFWEVFNQVRKEP